jgi:hypothetical protein
MTKTIALCSLPLFAVALFAQGPGGPGGRGPGGGFGGPFGGFGGFGPEKIVTGEPYSATETRTTSQTLANGNQIVNTKQSTVARDSQGRVSTSETIVPKATGKSPFTIETIFDPVAGYRYRLDSATMIANQMALPPKRVSSGTRPTPPANPNVTTTSLGTQVVNGVSATGTQITMTIPAAAIGNAQAISVVRVSWVSTALQVPVQIKTSDPRFGSSDMELTSIVQTEPAGTLFTVPAGYTVKTGGHPGAGDRKGGPAGHVRGGPPPGAQF